MRTLIKGGTVITATDQYRGDMLIEDEKIVVIGTSLDIQADKTIDAAGKYVLPGGIDVHTHLDMPFGGSKSSDDFESGTRAAAFGGTTSIVDFAIQYRGQTLHRDNLVGRGDLARVRRVGSGRPIHDRHEVVLGWERDHDLEQEPIELGLRQRVRPLLLQRVLRRHYEEQLL